MYVLAPNQTVEKFPYSIGELRRDNPNVSFPAQPSVELLAEWGVFPVEPVAPVYDSLTEEAFRLDPVWSEADQKWLDTWETRKLSAEESLERRKANVNYFGFYNGLLTSGAYQKIRTQALSSLALTVACTEFVAAITDAKYGQASIPALQACIDNIIAEAVLSDQDLQDLQRLFASFGMDVLYSKVWDGELPAIVVNPDGTLG